MALKIKQLFDEITKQKVYPLTTTKAVKDTTTKKSLFDILSVTPMMEEDEEEVSDTLLRDADTLGGQSVSYFATSRSVENVASSLSSEYDESVTYTVGQFCTRNNKLYKCVTETSGEFTVEDWAETTVENLVISANEEIKALENDLEELNNNLTALITTTTTTISISTTSGTVVSADGTVSPPSDEYSCIGAHIGYMGGYGGVLASVVEIPVPGTNYRYKVAILDNGAHTITIDILFVWRKNT